MNNKRLAEYSTADLKGMLAVTYGTISMATLAGGAVGLVSAYLKGASSKNRTAFAILGAAIVGGSSFLFSLPSVKAMREEIALRKE